MSPICKDTMAIFCKPKMSTHRLRLKPGDKTLECLTSDLVQKVGEMWSLFLGSTTSSYYSTMPMVPSAVRSHLINQHILEINMIKIILLNIDIFQRLCKSHVLKKFPLENKKVLYFWRAICSKSLKMGMPQGLVIIFLRYDSSFKRLWQN